MENAIERVADTIEDQNKPSKLEKPCDEGRDDRSSDLCAQWKAADAAQASAKFTGTTVTVGWIGLFLGAATMSAAIAAALFAKRAADHTKRAADAAHDANRPWLDILVNRDKNGALTWEGDQGSASFILTPVHMGPSPAINVDVGGFMVSAKGELKAATKQLIAQSKNTAWFPLAIFKSGEGEPAIWNFDFQIQDNAMISDGVIIPFFIAYVFYDVPGSTDRKMTLRYFQIGTTGGVINRKYCPIRGFNISIESFSDQRDVVT